MDKKSKYLIFGLILIFAVSLYWNYRVFFVDRDFAVDSTTTCDPQIESCFVWCDAGECEIDYYAKITKKASNIAICNETIEQCEPLVCEQNEDGCEITYCSGETVQANEECTNPRDFQMENPELISTSTQKMSY